MPRERLTRQSLGQVTYAHVKQVRKTAIWTSYSTHKLQAKVLLVGAGGIGCELLKNLVLTGFGEVCIIDLDTIDLSNLNRQFLFRQEHIKKPKALVAKEAAQKFNPNVKLVAYHANIKDTKFDIEWFSSFTLVFNALDNIDARRHVNKMCLAANVPLIESGTTGFNGQVQVIKKGQTACYDCSPKAIPKSFPVCTIRTTPSQSIHCIVWAKNYLLQELLGESGDTIPEIDSSEDSENAQEIAKLKVEAEALKVIRESMGSDQFAKLVFDKVFNDDIQRLAEMEDVWKGRKAPQPLRYDILDEQSVSIKPEISQDDQNIWSVSENFVVFRDSLSRLAKRLTDEQATALLNNLPTPFISFDKDDEDTLDFVTAAANIRAQIFDIESKSKFDTKQMAGNIIPAIATTNAMIAGLCVLQSFKVLKGDFERVKMMYLDRGNMSATTYDPPNENCVVCSMAMARLRIDPERATLSDLVSGILKTKLAYSDELSILSDKGLLYDPDLEDNLEKKLEDLGVSDGSFIVVKDDGDEDTPRVDLQLAIETFKEKNTTGPAVYLVLKDGETLEVPRKEKKKKADDHAQGEPNGVNGIAKSVENGDVQTSTGTGRRKRDADEAELEITEGTPVKKLQLSKPTKAPTDEHVVVVDEADGTIVLD
jgi:ubiquitin-like 1-activating enzyme E1 B